MGESCDGQEVDEEGMDRLMCPNYEWWKALGGWTPQMCIIVVHSTDNGLSVVATNGQHVSRSHNTRCCGALCSIPFLAIPAFAVRRLTIMPFLALVFTTVRAARDHMGSTSRPRVRV